MSEGEITEADAEGNFPPIRWIELNHRGAYNASLCYLRFDGSKWEHIGGRDDKPAPFRDKVDPGDKNTPEGTPVRIMLHTSKFLKDRFGNEALTYSKNSKLTAEYESSDVAWNPQLRFVRIY